MVETLLAAITAASLLGYSVHSICINCICTFESWYGCPFFLSKLLRFCQIGWRMLVETNGEQQFSSLVTDSQSDWSLSFDWDIYILILGLDQSSVAYVWGHLVGNWTSTTGSSLLPTRMDFLLVPDEKHSTNMMLSPPCFKVGMAFSGQWPKMSDWVLWDWRPCWVSNIWLHVPFFFSNNSCLLTTLSWCMAHGFGCPMNSFSHLRCTRNLSSLKLPWVDSLTDDWPLVDIFL